MNKQILEKLKKYDKFWLGFTLAFAAPFITMYIVYLLKFGNYTLKEFFDFLNTMRITTKLLSLCALPNMGIFFFYIWLDFLKGARGALAATFAIAFIIVILMVTL